jgi:hypothetical protein
MRTAIAGSCSRLRARLRGGRISARAGARALCVREDRIRSVRCRKRRNQRRSQFVGLFGFWLRVPRARSVRLHVHLGDVHRGLPGRLHVELSAWIELHAALWVDWRDVLHHSVSDESRLRRELRRQPQLLVASIAPRLVLTPAATGAGSGGCLAQRNPCSDLWRGSRSVGWHRACCCPSP